MCSRCRPDLSLFREALHQSQLQVQVADEREHQSRQFSQAVARIRLFAVGLALLLGVGAAVASFNTMSALIAIRERAVATLRVGFHASRDSNRCLRGSGPSRPLGGALGSERHSWWPTGMASPC